MKKNISAKRVFKIFGIVFGAVLAFVGIVVGVMAIMGKFKTPVVYPTELIFLENDKIVIAKETYDATAEPKDDLFDIYSFELTGLNSSAEHEVNKKNCYIWFYENVGANLITLCDEFGVPLQKNEKNRYLVQCNEPIYYMINEIDGEAETDGKVQIWAISENNKAMVNVPLTFWIDRVVEGVFVDTTLVDDIVYGESNTQKITVGVDIGFDFEYEVKTPLSLKPTSKETAKEVELYFVATGYDYDTTDYVKVTPEEVAKPNSPLNSILTYENGVFTFKSAKVGTYQFQIATFKTYQYKQDYLASIEGLTIDNPNYHRLTSNFIENNENINYMAVTELNIIVEPADVSEVGLMGTNVVLNLYSQKDYITLDGTSGVDDAKDNNLELYMKKGTGANSVADYSRFNEVTMTGFKDLSETFDNKIPEFQTDTENETWYYGESGWYGIDAVGNTINGNMIVELSNISLSSSLKIVNCLYKSDDENKAIAYYCTNGVAVLDTNGTDASTDDTIKILKAGSYLNFYAQDTSNNLTLIDFDYEASVQGTGRTKSWNVITKGIPDLTNGTLESTADDLTLRLGILVVNNHGKFKVEQFFSSVSVTINEIPLTYEIVNKNMGLDITFLNGGIMNYPKVAFEDLVQVTAGSYNACVFVTEKRDDGNYIIETIDGIEFEYEVNGQTSTYVLVGYEENGEFVNAVKVTDKVASDNMSCEIYMLQLKNAFDESVNDIVELLKNESNNEEPELESANDATIDVNSYVKELYFNNSITINSKYILNVDLLTTKYYDKYSVEGEDNIETNKSGDNYTVYEKTDGHKIVVGSTNKDMLAKVIQFYGVNNETKNSFFTINYSDTLEITSVELAKDGEEYTGEFIITYNTQKSLSDDTTVVTINLAGVGASVTLPGLLVLSGSPKDIILNAGEGYSITLSNSDIDAEASQQYLQATVSYEDGEYIYSYNLNGIYPISREVNIFNTQISSSADVGFQDAVDKGQILNVAYVSKDQSIFNTDRFDTMTNLVEKSGETVLAVEIGETTKYLRLKTITSGFTISSADDTTSFDEKIDKSFNLNDKSFGQDKGQKLVSLKYGTTDIALTKENLVFIENVKVVSYGDGNLIISPIDNGWELKKKIGTEIVDGQETDKYETILIIVDNNDGNGWMFTKSNQYITLTILFDVSTVAGTKTIEFTFSSDVNISVHDAWTNNRVFYVGTTVLLQSDLNTSVPVFDSTVSGISFKISHSLNNTTTSTTNSTFDVTDAYIGDIIIEIIYGGSSIHTFTDFEVRPNVIDNIVQVNKTITTEKGEQTIKVDKTFKSGTVYQILDAENNPGIYNLQQYDTSITYGNSASELYFNLFYYTDNTYKTVSDTTTQFIKIGARNNLTDISNDNKGKLTIAPKAELNAVPNIYWDADTESDNYNKFVIGEMTELGVTKTRTINLMFGTHVVSTREIKIENKYDIDIDEDEELTFKALKEYATTFAKVNEFTLNEIAADNLTFVVGSGEFKITTAVVQELKDVDVVLTFVNGDITLTYQTKFTIIPYTPEENRTIESAYSGSSYDLFGGIYNASSIEQDENVKSLLVTSVLDENRDDITSEIINGEFAPSGYTQGETGANCEIVFNEIQGESKVVKIQYTITYSNNLTYTYNIDLTILNRQSIEVNYPENDLIVENGTFKFLSGFEQDGATISKKEFSSEGLYTIDSTLGLNYEPIMLFTDNSQIVEFDYDDVKKINRSVVENKEDAETTESKSTDLTITLIGYQNNPGMAEYVTRINTKYDTNTISLPYAIQGMSGTLVFKLETVSGNAKYYYIYVYCVGTSSSINEENYLEVVAYKDTLSLDKYSNENVATIAITAETTYGDIVSALGNSTDLYSKVDGNQTFLGIFGKTYKNTTTKVYLYNGTYTGETDDDSFNYNGKQWKQVDEDIIVLDERFNTITLGLLYQSGVEMYVYGTITIYVQPTTAISGDLTYVVPNGEFEKTIEANATSITSPFGDTWTAKIISIDGVDYNDERHNDYSASGSTVSMAKRVATDTIIRVEYISNEGTIVCVNYTYKATILPTESTITIGKFDNGFINTIELVKEGKYNETFFKTYADKYSVDDSHANVVWNEENHTLKFEQTTEQQVIDVTFTYTNFGDGTNNTRTFTFIVQPGISYDENVNDSTSGLSSSKRALTTQNKDDSGNLKYDSTIGSKLEIKYTAADDANKFDTYIIGGLTIYTDKTSKLKLTFDENSYVIDPMDKNLKTVLSSTGYIDVTTSTYVNFTHSAQETPVTMSIQIVQANTPYDEYATRNFYLTVIPTYSMLDATYLVAGADHENVPNVDENKAEYKIENLHSTLLNTNRMQLLGTTINTETGDYTPISGADLLNMGFATFGNPNYVDFSVGSNATIKNSPYNDPDVQSNTQITNVNIVFNKVTTNTLCDVYLNNNAGMSGNSVWYTYQIMAGSEVDGLDYSSTNGIHVEATESQNEYISFMMNDTGKVEETTYTSEKFVIGSMLDENNTSIFNVEIKDGENVIISRVDTPTELNTDGDVSIYKGGYFHGWQYQFSLDAYLFYLTYDTDNNRIELIIERPKNVEKQDFVLTIDIAGVNGFVNNEGSIVSGLEIVLSNHKISGKFEDSTDMSIYSGYTIDLTEKINGDNSDISYELLDSSYVVDGETRYIYKDDSDKNDNELFKFDSTKKTLETRAVGSDVRATVVFLAKANGYALKEITYNFQIKLNMQFVVNGGSLAENVGNTTPETRFVLTNDIVVNTTTNSGNFPISTYFISKQQFNSNTNYKVDKSGVDSYYNILVVELYRLHVQNNEEATETDLLMSRNLFTVELYSNIENGILKIVQDENGNYGIQFLKDYTGELELKLSLKTDNGTYYVIWTVYIEGIKDINYTSSNPETARIQNNSLPFNSNETVNLISSSTGTGVGILMENAPTFQSDNVKMNFDYSYKINTVNDTTKSMTNEQLFGVDSSFAYYQGGGMDTKIDDESTTNNELTQNSWKITLPSVPSTTDDASQSYFVTYEVAIEYLSSETNSNKFTFYVTYMVINRQQVETYEFAGKQSSDIDVDDGKDIEIIDVDEDGVNEYYLNLFYYKSTAISTVGTITTNYMFEYINGDITLTVGEETYTYDSESGNYKTFVKDSENTIVYDVANEKLYKSSVSTSNEIAITKWSTTPNYPETETGTIHSVFKSEFTNIFEYANFIATYLNKTKDATNDTYIAIGDKAFTLVHIKDGRYGIDLAEQFKDDHKFNNELLADLKLVENGVTTVTISAYSAVNTAGFRLTTSQKIIANTNGGEGYKLSTMFLPKYFTRNYILTQDTEIDSTKTYYTIDGETYTAVESPVASNISSYYELSEVTLSTSIIGVGMPDDSWVDVESATVSVTPNYNDIYATISIPSDTDTDGETIYKYYYVKKVRYEAGSSTLYNIQQDFYFLTNNKDGNAENNEEVVVPDYNAVGIESTFFKVTYSPNLDYQEVDLIKGFKVWIMNGGTLVDTGSINALSGGTIICSDASKSSNFEFSIEDESKVIRIETSKLNDYKAEYPNKKNYPTATATINVNGNNYLCEVVFALADYVTIDKQFDINSSNNLDITLIEKIWIPKSSTGYEQLTDENLTKVKFVDEISSGGYVMSYSNGDLTLDCEKLKTYFETEDYLYIT
ncbi:MAG: hypothetical protein IJ415_04565, partial [Clostridia bacterium]|nr:hypothetical protein [Clostridia bacterium]